MGGANTQPGRLRAQLLLSGRIGTDSVGPLRGMPGELIEGPFLRLKARPGSGCPGLLERSVELFAADPVGPHADMRLEAIKAVAGASTDKREIFTAAGKVLEGVHGISDLRDKTAAAEKAARFLVDLLADQEEAARGALIEDLRPLIPVISATTRKELIELLKQSGCIYDEAGKCIVDERHDLIAFDLVDWKPYELDYLGRDTRSKLVAQLANFRIYEMDRMDLDSLLKRIKGPISAVDFLEGTHGSIQECLMQLPNVDTTELVKVVDEKRRRVFIQTLRERPESYDADAVITELVGEATRKPQLYYNMLDAVTLLSEALAATSDAGKRKIASAFALILSKTEDPVVRSELEGHMAPAMTGCGEMLKKLLAETRDLETLEGLLALARSPEAAGEPEIEMDEDIRRILGAKAQIVPEKDINGILEAKITNSAALFHGTEGPETEKYLDRMSRIAAMGSTPELAFHAARMIMEAAARAEGTENREAISEKAAWSLLHMVSRVPERHLDDVLGFISTWLRACSPSARAEMLGIIRNGDGSDLSAFHLSSPDEAELIDLRDNAASEAVRGIAGRRLLHKRGKDAAEAREWKREYFTWLMAEDAETEEADRALSSLVAEITSPSASLETIDGSVMLMAQALPSASERGKERLALAAADIHEGMNEGARKRFAASMAPVLAEHKPAVISVIKNPKEKNDRVRSLFTLMMKNLTQDEGYDILIAAKKRRINEEIEAFVSGPSAFGADRHLGKAVEIATKNEHKSKLELDVAGMLFDTITKTKGTPDEGVAAKRLARAVVDLVAGTEDELKEEVVSLVLAWLPKHSDLVREEMLDILRNSECEETSKDKRDIVVFALVHPTIEELGGLVEGPKKARSGYVRGLAAERKELEESFKSDTEIEQERVAAFKDALAEFRDIATDPEGKKFLLGDILYVADDSRTKFSDYGKDGLVDPEGMPHWKHAKMGSVKGVIDTGAEKPKTKPPEREHARTNLQKAAMRVERTLAELSAENRRGILAEMVLESLHAFGSNPAGPGSWRHLESIASAAGTWEASEGSFVSDTIKIMVRSAEGVTDKAAKERASRMVAEALLVIAKEAKKDVRSAVISEIRAGSAKRTMFDMLADGKFDKDSTEKAKGILDLADLAASDLEHLIKNGNVSNVVRVLARLKKAENKRGGKPPEPLDGDERAVLEHVLQTVGIYKPFDSDSMPEEALVDELILLDPGRRHIIMRNFVTSYSIGPDWRIQVDAAGAAADGVCGKLGLEEPDAFEKRDALKASPDLLTAQQRRLVAELAGWGIVNGKVEPALIEKTANRLAGIDRKTVRKEMGRKLLTMHPFTRFASLAVEHRRGGLTVDKLRREDRRDELATLSNLVGKLESEMTDDDVAIFMKKLADKDRKAFEALRTSDIDTTMEKFREAAHEAREMSDLLDFLGVPAAPMRACLNGECSGAAREVFELGLASGLLYTMEGAAVLCEVADLAIATMNYDELAAGRISDMREGQGSAVSFTLQAGNENFAITYRYGGDATEQAHVIPQANI